MTLQSKSNIMYKIMQRDLNLNGENKQIEWYAEKLGTRVIEGFQLRYIKILDPAFHLSVPEIPFSKIDEIGAGMYKGERETFASRHVEHTT